MASQRKFHSAASSLGRESPPTAHWFELTKTEMRLTETEVTEPEEWSVFRVSKGPKAN